MTTQEPIVGDSPTAVVETDRPSPATMRTSF
jgi:hypothetical protein